MLDFYWKLASDTPSERLEAAVGLLDGLTKADSESDWDYALNRLVRGLSSSRGSARLGFSMALSELLNVRQDKISVNDYLDLVEKHFKNFGKVSGHEERGYYFGQLFSLQILSKSPLLKNKDESLTSRELERYVDLVLSLAAKKTWLRESSFFALCGFLEMSLQTDTDNSKSSKSSKSSKKRHATSVSDYLVSFVDLVLSKVHKYEFTYTLEGVAVYLTIPAEYVAESKFLKSKEGEHVWKNGDPLLKTNLNKLSSVLRDIPVSEVSEDNKKAAGGYQNAKNVHFVWHILATKLLNSPSTVEAPVQKKHKKTSKTSNPTDEDASTNAVPLGIFWKSVVDEGYFSQSTSPQRKYLGFEIFNLFMTAFSKSINIAASKVEVLFGTGFMKVCCKHSSSQEKQLNKAAKHSLSVVVKAATENTLLCIYLIEKLLQYSFNFDFLTKTRTVETLISHLPETDWSEMIDLYINIFIEAKNRAPRDEKEDNEGNDSEKENDGNSNNNEISGDMEGKDKKKKRSPVVLQQLYALDGLLGLIKHHKSAVSRPDTDAIWIERILDFYILYGFFEASPMIAEDVVSACQTRISSVMSLLMSKPRSHSTSWAYFTISRIVKLENDGSHVLLNPFDDDDEENGFAKAKNKAIKTLEKTHKKRLASKHADTSQLEAFELLFSLVLIQIYSVDSDAASILDELQLCYNKIVGKSRNEEGGEDDDNIDASQVLTDILLSFMSRQSALLRKLSEEVWSTFTSKVSRESLNLLYDILGARETKEGQESLFDDDDEVMGTEEDEEEEVEEDNNDDDDLESSESDDDIEESDSDSDGIEDDKVKDYVEEANRQATLALSKALGISKDDQSDASNSDNNGHNDDNNENYEDDDEDEDDESMDDEQMMALDAQLSTIFTERRKALTNAKSVSQKKAMAKDAKENMVQFKSRVLDLLDIYIKNEPSNWLVVTMVIPLLNVIRTTKDKQLGEKSHALLKSKLCKIKVTPPINKEDQLERLALATDIFNQIHKQQALKAANKAHTLACSQASVFVAKLLIGLDSSTGTELVVKEYSASFTEWITNPHSKLAPSMFFDIVNYFGSLKKAK